MHKLTALALVSALGAAASGQVVINEVWQNPPGGNDEFWEYIELYGTPGMSLDGYALALTQGGRDINGDDIADTFPEIDEAYTLDGLTIGDNGLLVLLNDTGGGSFSQDFVDAETNIGYFTAQHIDTTDTPGKLNNDGSTTWILLRERPIDNVGGFPSSWRKESNPDSDFDSRIDFGSPWDGGRMLEPYQMVDDMAWSHDGGKEYTRESDDEISDTPGFNPDSVTRYWYYGENPGPQPRRADEEWVYGEQLDSDILLYDTDNIGGPTGFDFNDFFITPGGFNDSANETQFRFTPGDVDFDGAATGADFCWALENVGATLDDTEPKTDDAGTPDDPADDIDYTGWKWEGRAFNGLLVAMQQNDDGSALTLADVAALRDIVCMGDFNGDGLVNSQDVLGYLNVWVAGDACADTNLDGTVNTTDFLAFLNFWSGGC